MSHYWLFMILFIIIFQFWQTLLFLVLIFFIIYIHIQQDLLYVIPISWACIFMYSLTKVSCNRYSLNNFILRVLLNVQLLHRHLQNNIFIFWWNIFFELSLTSQHHGVWKDNKIKKIIHIFRKFDSLHGVECFLWFIFDIGIIIYDISITDVHQHHQPTYQRMSSM